MLSFIVSKNIHDYKPVLQGLTNDFGLDHYPAILIWCGILDDDVIDQKFWQIWLIKEEDKVIGICGLYSLQPTNEELWLAWFGIIPEYRGKKFGVSTLDFLSIEARIAGANKLMSYVDKEGKPLPFYFKYGFHMKSDVKTYLAEHPELSEDSFGNLEDSVIEMPLIENSSSVED